jgi:carboxyl-terminal processing protease
MLRAYWVGQLAIMSSVWAAPGWAAEPAADTPAKTHAVLVGVSKYTDPKIQPRPHAEADAKALYDLLTDKTYLGAASDDVKLLLDTPDGKRHSEPASKANIVKAITDAVDKAGKNDLVLIAMIGQGAGLGDKETCFLASDSTYKDRAKDAVSSKDIENAIAKLQSQKLCAIMDIDYKGINHGKEVVPDPNILDMLRVFVGNEDKEEHTLPPGRVVILSNNSVSRPLDLPSQGMFSKVLIDGLKGAADKDGYEPDGVVTVEELDTYLEKEMGKQARQIGKNSEEKEQAAFTLGGKTNHFVLTHNPTVMPKVEERLKKLDSLKLDPEAMADGRRLLTRMPKLKAEQELRKAYQQLCDGTITQDAFLKLRTDNLAARKLDKDSAETFAKRTYRGVQMVHDQYVKELVSGEMVGWAIRGLYQRVEAKLPPEIKERLDKVKDMRRGELEDLLADARMNLGQRADLDSNKDVDLSLQMMMSHLDPYTVYIDKESKLKAETELKGRFPGIGIQIRRVAAKDALLVVSPIKGSPAYRAGLKAGDLVTSIETDRDDKGRPLEGLKTFSTQGMKTETAVKHILGPTGTKVKVTVEREGVPHPMEFEIRRGMVEVETVLGAKRKTDDSWDYYIDPENKIGYIQLTQFGPGSFRDMLDAVKHLDKSGLKGLVLDLRDNPGGLLSTAVQISDLFIDDGLIVTIRPRVGQEQAYGGEHEGSKLDFPMVCMVNNGSASGSEIVAACLQDQKRALIIGERSYGKGSVQNIQPFSPTDGEIKLTTATFHRPNGKNLNKSSIKDYEKMSKGDLELMDWGVRPDDGYLIKLDPKERFDLDVYLHEREIIPRRDAPPKDPKDVKPEFKDRQLETALDYLRSQIKTAAQLPTKKAG